METWLDSPPSAWVTQAYAVDGPFYQAAAAMLLLSPDKWSQKRVHILQRLLLTVHIRAGGAGTAAVAAAASSDGADGGTPKMEIAEYSVYRPALMFFAMVDLIIKDMWAGVHTKPDQVRICSNPHQNSIEILSFFSF